ncbi:MAG: NUDIX domain-containing protein [Dehalococcoidia bacterium]
MRHRIRAAALITEGNSILLVKEVQDGREWWVPPGGGVEGDEDIYECARRETLEETGLDVTLRRQVVYIREFIERATDTHHIELFLAAERVQGKLIVGSNDDEGPYSHFIQDVRYVPRSQLGQITVYPAALLDGFWDDLAAGFPSTRNLGLEMDDHVPGDISVGL